MIEQTKKLGIKEIARRAGVSIGTVDRVLHNRGEVKKETHDKIIQIINELGYTPNPLAQALSLRKTANIAIIIPNSSDNNPYWQKPVEGIAIAQKELSAYNVTFNTFYFNATKQESFISAINQVIKAAPDGVLICPAFKNPAIQFFAQLDAVNIPYVFVDININDTNSIGYFGQDAFQSGVIAAKLMCQNIDFNSTIIIVKQSAHKIFSDHIESRINGFCSVLDTYSICAKIVEIDLSYEYEPQNTMQQYFIGKKLNIFVPNSRAFVLADLIEKLGVNYCNIIGYDLIDENVKHLKNGTINYLLNQRPDEQSYKAIMRLFNYVLGRKATEQKNNFSPIDIIIKENVDYYRKSLMDKNLYTNTNNSIL